MSVLDVFYILFKSQGADQVKKEEDGLKETGDKLNQSMQESASISQKMGSAFDGLGRQLAHTLTAAVSLGAILHGIKDSINYAEDVDLASRMLAVNVDELDAWDNAVRRTGGTAEQFQGSLKRLAQQLGTSGQVALQILPQLADSFQQMGRFASIRYGEMLGLDENTILLLQKGRREVEDVIKQQKELGVVSKKDAEEARAFNFAWQDATHSLRMAFLGVAEELLPLFTSAVEGFGKAAAYFKKHSDLIVGGLIAIGIASVFAFPEFYVGAAAVTALASAFALLYEDIKFYLEGADSLIGRIEKKWPKFFKEMRLELEAWSKFFKGVNAFGDQIDSFGDKFEKTRDQLFSGMFGGSDKPANSGFALSSEEIEKLKSTKLRPLKNALDIATTSSVSYTKPSDLSKYAIPSKANKSVTVNTGPVTVNTQATDGKGTANAFGNFLNDQITQANNYFDDGIAI